MKCQQCAREATVHLTETVEGRRRELHLCGSCARAAGLAPPAEPPGPALEAVVDHLITKHVGELVGELAEARCPLCGLAFMEFRSEGRLGCPHDYRTFARGLAPLLRKAQPADRHVGKRPKRSGSHTATERLGLRAQLRDAVAREDYERAAALRDQLRLEDAHQ